MNERLALCLHPEDRASNIEDLRFEIQSERINIMLETSERRLDIKWKEARLKVLLENGNEDDLNYLYDAIYMEAGKEKMTIGERISYLINMIIDGISALFTGKGSSTIGDNDDVEVPEELQRQVSFIAHIKNAAFSIITTIGTGLLALKDFATENPLLSVMAVCGIKALLDGKESDDERKAREDAEYEERKKAKKESKKEGKSNKTKKESGKEVYKSLDDIRDALKTLNELNDELNKKEKELKNLTSGKVQLTKSETKKADKLQGEIDELKDKKEEQNTQYEKAVQGYNASQNKQTVDIDEYEKLKKYHEALKNHLNNLKSEKKHSEDMVHNANFYYNQTKGSRTLLEKINPFGDKNARREYKAEKEVNKTDLEEEKRNLKDIEAEIKETERKKTETYDKIREMETDIKKANRSAEIAMNMDDSKKRVDSTNPSKQPQSSNKKETDKTEEKKDEGKKDGNKVSEEDKGLISKAINGIRGAVNKLIQWINGLYKRFREIVTGESEETATESTDLNLNTEDLDYLDSVIFSESFVDEDGEIEATTQAFYEAYDDMLTTL